MSWRRLSSTPQSEPYESRDSGQVGRSLIPDWIPAFAGMTEVIFWLWTVRGIQTKETVYRCT